MVDIARNKNNINKNSPHNHQHRVNGSQMLLGMAVHGNALLSHSQQLGLLVKTMGSECYLWARIETWHSEMPPNQMITVYLDAF